jgi:hypothetical protein
MDSIYLRIIAVMKWYFPLLPILISLSSFCQDKADTTRLQELITLSRKNQWIDPNKSLQYADQALLLAQTLNNLQGVAMANI